MTPTSEQLPSNRKFGYFFSFLFAAAAFYLFLKGDVVSSASSVVLFAVTLVIAFIAPNLLRPFNLLWFRLGLLLGKFISPIVLGTIFFLIITPLAVIMRLSGRDELRLRTQSANTHWKDRVPPGPEPKTFKNQF